VPVDKWDKQEARDMKQCARLLRSYSIFEIASMLPAPYNWVVDTMLLYQEAPDLAALVERGQMTRATALGLYTKQVVRGKNCYDRFLVF
jgi:hypothetical protein